MYVHFFHTSTIIYTVHNYTCYLLDEHIPYIFPSSDRIIFLLPQGGYIANASWNACSISGAQTPN